MDTMKKTLILINDIFYQFKLEQFKDKNIRCMPMLLSDTDNKLYRAIRKLHLSYDFPFRSMWFYEWDKIIEQYDTIILGDAGNSYNVARYIKHFYSDKRVIIWYRNTVTEYNDPSHYNRSICELWTFDIEDSKKYRMKYNHQFYVPQSDFKDCAFPEYDVFFVGEEKGRMKELESIESYLRKKGFSFKFCVIGINSDRIPYDEVLDYISKSKTILDIQISRQNGITLRPLEALYYGKKLITNSRNLGVDLIEGINNTYLIEDEEYEGLDDFLRKPIKKTDESLMNEYSIFEWVNRFYES